MRCALAPAAIGLLLAVGGCQGTPNPHAPVVDLDEARRALASHDWTAAAPHLRAALEKDPQSLFLHYNLAICATWLDVKDEAVREFEWVVAHTLLSPTFGSPTSVRPRRRSGNTCCEATSGATTDSRASSPARIS